MYRTQFYHNLYYLGEELAKALEKAFIWQYNAKRVIAQITAADLLPTEPSVQASSSSSSKQFPASSSIAVSSSSSSSSSSLTASISARTIAKALTTRFTSTNVASIDFIEILHGCDKHEGLHISSSGGGNLARRAPLTFTKVNPEHVQLKNNTSSQQGSHKNYSKRKSKEVIVVDEEGIPIDRSNEVIVSIKKQRLRTGELNEFDWKRICYFATEKPENKDSRGKIIWDKVASQFNNGRQIQLPKHQIESVYRNHKSSYQPSNTESLSSSSSTALASRSSELSQPSLPSLLTPLPANSMFSYNEIVSHELNVASSGTEFTDAENSILANIFSPTGLSKIKNDGSGVNIDSLFTRFLYEAKRQSLEHGVLNDEPLIVYQRPKEVINSRVKTTKKRAKLLGWKKDLVNLGQYFISGCKSNLYIFIYSLYTS